jgi:hypothetical protein
MVSTSLHNLFREGKKKIKKIKKKGRKEGRKGGKKRKGKLKDEQEYGGYDRLQNLA